MQIVGPGVFVKLILLVDDSRFQRITNERLLVKAGYEVVTAADGEEALRMASSRTPDLVILDMLLPKLGGPEVLKSLTRNPTTASIPVVVLSSLTQANEAKLIEEGASAYLEKSRIEGDPNLSALLATVARTLKNKVRVVRSGSPHPAPQEPTPSRGEGDLHAGSRGQS
jgi:twitching motility two-component system response regulator PilH